MSTRSVVHFSVIPARREELVQLFQEDMEATHRHEPGAERFELYQSVLDENRFVFIEQWRSREDHAAHTKLPLVRRLWSAFREDDFIQPVWVTWRCEQSGSAEANE